VDKRIRALAVTLVLALGAPALLDAQQSQPARPGMGTTENPGPGLRGTDAERADRDSDMDWGWLGLIGLLGLFGLRRRDVHDEDDRSRSAERTERTATYR
jgi:MYXO-CTERM domain-containing protein